MSKEANTAKAREHYATRAERRPQQIWVWSRRVAGHWEKVTS